MAKNKKTKQQKKIADLRRKLQFQAESKQSLSGESKKFISKQTPEKSFEKDEDNNLNTTVKYSSASTHNFNKDIRNKNSTNNYIYIIEDIKRTGILTGSFIAAQLILFYLLKTHTIVLPIVKY